MWNRKELKKNARLRLKSNYWNIVMICLMLFVFAGSFLDSDTITDVAKEIVPSYAVSSNSEIVNATIRGGYEAVNDGKPYSLEKNGVLGGVFNNITKSGSFIFGILNAFNQFVFGDKVGAGIIILLGSILGFLYWVFIKNLLKVGACRFFLENRFNKEEKANRILYIFKIRRIRNAAKIMLLRTVYICLWSLTIIGGIIKAYSYCMVPYILASNPDISSKEAFNLSQEMMKGNKWRAFKLDVSFIVWHLISMFTFGIVGFLFVNPYVTLTEVELYYTLRAEVGDKNIELVMIEEHPNRKWLTVDHVRSYSISSLILLFFSFSFIGWVWEVAYTAFTDGIIVNRGTLSGPWLPIYGSGGVLLLILLKRWMNKPVKTFFLAIVICGVLEYSTSWLLETIYHTKWWDYTGYLLNLNGRICFEGLLVFGLGGCLMIYSLAPMLDDLFAKIPKHIKMYLCIILCTVFIIDTASSFVNPNMGKGVTVDPNRKY